MEDIQRRIEVGVAELRARFGERMRATPSLADAAPQGDGPANRHGMPKEPPGQNVFEKHEWPVLDLGDHALGQPGEVAAGGGRRGGDAARALLRRPARAPAGRRGGRLPLRDGLVDPRPRLPRRPPRDGPGAGAPDRRRDARDDPRARRLLDQPPARGGAEARRAARPHGGGSAAHAASTAGRCGLSSRSSTPGRAPSGSRGSSSSRTIAAGTGRSAGTPTPGTRGATIGCGERAPGARTASYFFRANDLKKPTICPVAPFQSSSAAGSSSLPSTQTPPQDSQVS